jgi:hypothetical protein
VIGKEFYMASKAPKVRPSDLPTKIVHGPNGESVRVKVIQSESATLPYDLLAAFQSNVRRIRANQRKRARAANDTKEA